MNVTRKPSKCPICGEEVWDIIYGTGDLPEWKFLYKYRKSAIMGGDNIPKNPPLWACSCGCKRFRKVNWDGSVAPVKVKLLKNVRKGSLEKFNIEINEDLDGHKIGFDTPRHAYKVQLTTNLGEKECMYFTAISPEVAIFRAYGILDDMDLGFKGTYIKDAQIVEE
jgi:hypothetical protein